MGPLISRVINRLRRLTNSSHSGPSGLHKSVLSRDALRALTIPGQGIGKRNKDRPNEATLVGEITATIQGSNSETYDEMYDMDEPGEREIRVRVDLEQDYGVCA